MYHFKIAILLAFCITGLPAVVQAQEATPADTGTLSLATNPEVMVYIDGQRVGMSPIINRRLGAGEHRVSLLLILPSGNRLRADYRVLVAPGRDTVASLDLARDPPAEGEVRTLGPPPERPVAPPPPPPPPPPPAAGGPGPAETPPAGGGSWATSPGRPRAGPVTVAEIAPAAPPPPPAAPPPPEPRFGLSRDLVREGMEAMRPAIERCMQGGAGLVQVRLNIQPDGGVADVEVQGAFRGTRIGDCIEAALPEEAAFPIYTGEAIPVVYPFRVVPE